MLPTFNLPGKNISPDRQLAMMRTYLNDLKDNTEGELYNIRWDNLAKPLKEKIESLEKYSASNKEYIDELNANTVRTQYLETNYLTAQEISATYVTSQYLTSEFIYTKSLNASQITAGRIGADYLDSNVIYTTNISSYAVDAQYVDTAILNADYISTDYLDVEGYIKTTYIHTDAIRSGLVEADDILANGKIKASVIDTGTLVFNGLKYTPNGSYTINLSLVKVQKYGGGEAWCLGTLQTP